MIDNTLKWTATTFLFIGTIINSLGYYPAGPLVLSVGGSIWLIVAIRWREASLIATNCVMLLATAIGLAYRHLN